MPNTLTDWLTYLESLHPKTIALGLERVEQVRQRLNLSPDFPIIVVGGTNGKASVGWARFHLPTLIYVPRGQMKPCPPYKKPESILRDEARVGRNNQRALRRMPISFGAMRFAY